MKKSVGILFLIVFSAVFMSAIVGIAGMWHNADEVIIKIDGYNVTLNDAINNKWLYTTAVPTENSIIYSNAYHYASEISIKIGGNIMSIQDAFNNELFMRGGTRVVDKTTMFHNSSEINIGDKDFQEAFDDGDFKCVSIFTPAADTRCPGASFTQSDDCGNTKSAVGTQDIPCGENECKNPGITQCDGSCSGATNKVDGTACSSGTCLNGMCSKPLVNNKHSASECSNAGGTVVGTAPNQFCKFIGYSCASGWTQYSNWGKTTSRYCHGASSCSSCKTGSHVFSNTPIETCGYEASRMYMRPIYGSMGEIIVPGYYMCLSTGLCSATPTEIGCY